MKHYLFATFVLFVVTACNSNKLISQKTLEARNYQEISGMPNTASESERLFERADINAMYPDGTRGIYQHIAKNVKFPESARKNNIQGKVVLTFIVEKNGYVSNVTVIESVSEDVDKEAIRLISSLERFYPAFQNGKPVRILYTQPINFSLK